VDDNETAEEAVVREIREELNANVTDLKYLFRYPTNMSTAAGQSLHWICFSRVN